jgi:hypothetical protein
MRRPWCTPSVTGGIPGWQIILIAAAVLAAAIALILDPPGSRRHLTAPSA